MDTHKVNVSNNRKTFQKNHSSCMIFFFFIESNKLNLLRLLDHRYARYDFIRIYLAKKEPPDETRSFSFSIQNKKERE